SPGSNDHLQYRDRPQDQGKDLAHARTKFYFLVGRYFGWKEGSFPDSRTRAGQLSTGGATPSYDWRWRTDRCDAVPPGQPSLDSLSTLPLLSGLASGCWQRVQRVTRRAKQDRTIQLQ